MSTTRIYEEIEEAIFRSISANEAYKKIEKILKDNIKCVKSVNIVILTANNSSKKSINNKSNDRTITKTNKTPSEKNTLVFAIADDKRDYAVLEIRVSDDTEARKELNESFMKNILDLLLYTYKRFHM